MPLIRNKHAGHITPRAVALELDDVRAEAAGLVEEAQGHVEQMKASARAQLQQERARVIEDARDQGRREGHEEGLAAGRQAGMEAALEEALEDHKELLATIAPEWAGQLSGFGEERQRLMEEARREIISFAVALASRLVHRTIEHDEQVCVEQVAGALELIGQQARLTITISPLDRAVLEHALPGVLEAARCAADVELLEDPALTRGGCIISTPEGSVDATLETQLRRIAETLVPGLEP